MSDTIFLTGGTGYLGGYVVSELLKRSDRDLVLLTRARSDDEAREKLADGRLREARSLCDRVMSLNPLMDGLVELSDEIDAQIADDRRRSALGEE